MPTMLTLIDFFFFSHRPCTWIRFHLFTHNFVCSNSIRFRLHWQRRPLNCFNLLFCIEFSSLNLCLFFFIWSAKYRIRKNRAGAAIGMSGVHIAFSVSQRLNSSCISAVNENKKKTRGIRAIVPALRFEIPPFLLPFAQIDFRFCCDGETQQKKQRRRYFGLNGKINIYIGNEDSLNGKHVCDLFSFFNRFFGCGYSVVQLCNTRCRSNCTCVGNYLSGVRHSQVSILLEF